MTHHPIHHPRRYGALARRLLATALAFSALIFTGCFHTGMKKLPTAFDMSTTSLKALGDATADKPSVNYVPANALMLFDAGVAISDKSFEEFFASFDTFQRTVAHNQTASNIAASTAVGVLGFTGATSKTLGLIGVAQAGLNAEFKNFESVYLLSPALDIVYTKLTEARRIYAAKIRAEVAKATTYGQVRALIVEYHATGSLLAIRNYIRAATNIAKFDVVDSNDIALDTTTQIEFTTLLQALTYTASPQLTGMDSDIAFLLYLKTTNRPTYDKFKEVADIIHGGAAATATSPSAAARAALATDFGALLNLSRDAAFGNATVNSSAAIVLRKLAPKLEFDKRVAAIIAALNTPTPAAGAPAAAAATPSTTPSTAVRSIQVR